MGVYILEAKRIGHFSLLLHTGDRISLNQGDKHELTIDRLTSEHLSFYKNYRHIGVDFYPKRKDASSTIQEAVKHTQAPGGFKKTEDVKVEEPSNEPAKVEPNEPATAVAQEQKGATEEDLRRLTKAELLQKCKDLGIEDASEVMTKEQIIGKLQENK